jgi:hypothetical protein
MLGVGTLWSKKTESEQYFSLEMRVSAAPKDA